ncbi:fibronectin type III domain-containing protein [Marseilla massiliensis]|jgi:hypothetical protein|uniref:Fibronectin type III domain-containing protein n=1 Tax=Marseilla massiliensis TaxID=1841864 RepID=A0A939B868_9BACT|nr:fibronectin type III domain-containing protein [Marseilla massiliensis]MBM6674187.1 fibronectin type III domain-containing protein [Marseilla massiliensis]
MKRNIYKAFVLGFGVLTLASCDDPMDEITSIIYDRVFAPTELEARNPRETSVTLQWNASKDAVDYSVQLFADDSLAFEGEPDVTLTTSETSIDITGLVYDTRYSARVMANDSVDTDRNSKWSEVTFKTAAQQIMESITENDTGDKNVTVRWPVGEEVTSIKIMLYGTTELAVPEYTITPEDLAAGSAYVDGLNPETRYDVYLYNNGKQRGHRDFTTIADLEGAIQVHDTDDLQTLLEEAQDGDVFALYGGTFIITPSDDPEVKETAGCATISKNITIKGIYPTSRPVINGRFQLDDGASLSLSQVVLDGTGTSGDQTFNYKTDGVTYASLDVQDCEIKNYTKGILYLNVTATISNVTFNNCLIHDIECDGGDFLDSRKGLIGTLNITNSTIYNSATGRDFIRIDDASGSFPGAAGPIITVDHCTIDGVANSSSRRLLYVRFPGNTITWTNNMVSNMPECGRGFSDNSATDVPNFSNNNYYNTKNLVSEGGEEKARFFDESGYTDDPQYKDAANGDFTIQNEDVSTRQIGDPRWYTAQE